MAASQSWLLMPMKRFCRPFAYGLGAFVVSYIAAAILNTTSLAWSFVEQAPKPVVNVVGRVLLVLFWPVLPEGVHEQEEMLELLLIWVFSGLAILPPLAFMLVVLQDARRSKPLSSANP